MTTFNIKHFSGCMGGLKIQGPLCKTTYCLTKGYKVHVMLFCLRTEVIPEDYPNRVYLAPQIRDMNTCRGIHVVGFIHKPI